MSMKKMIAGVLATGALAATAMPASAAVVLPDGSMDPLTCNGLGTSCAGGFDSAFTLAGPDFDFLQKVTFTLDLLGTIDSSVTTKFTDAFQNINFTSITIDGVHAFTQTGFDPVAETWAISNLHNLASGEHYIEFAGNLEGGGPGSYGAQLTFSAVPEPATWAMMLLGFAVVGGAMRRRERQTRVRYSVA